ncbi:MAG: NADH-quinone oxidoreductase subunit NuoE [Candidatus Nanopelagicales bacterium]
MSIKSITDSDFEVLESLAQKYPQRRSALLPMLHYVQSVQGMVSPAGIQACAKVLDLTPAEVAAVATFYTMFKRFPMGKHHIGVCTNTLCALLGGDELWKQLTETLGIGHDETTSDAMFTLERIECQAACTVAPVMTVNWEFMDSMTPEKVRDLIEKLKSGTPVKSTRGVEITSISDSEKLLAGINDGKYAQSPGADESMLAGLKVAKERNMSAPVSKAGK